MSQLRATVQQQLGILDRLRSVEELPLARPAPRTGWAAFPKVAEWLKSCAERPAASATRQLQRE
jgi:glutathione S-transferase